MALTRAFLKGMGLSEEQENAIIEAHIETVDGLKAFKEKAEKYDDAVAEVDKLKEQLKDNKPNTEAYDKLKAEFEAYKNDIAEKELNANKEKAYREILKACGISEKRIDTVIKASAEGIKLIEFDKEGNVKNADKLTESLKTEWADFIATTTTTGINTATPRVSNDTKKVYKSKEEILEIADRAERRQAIKDNPELFGAVVTNN